MDPTARFYSRPSYVGGINIPVYSGSRRQTGGGVFGSIKRAIVPTLKTAGKEMGKQALGLFTDVAQDVLSGENLGDSIKQRAKERAAEAARRGIKTLTNTATHALRQTTRKRKASTHRPPPAKRARRQQQYRVRRAPIRKVTRQMRYIPKYRARPLRRLF